MFPGLHPDLGPPFQSMHRCLTDGVLWSESLHFDFKPRPSDCAFRNMVSRCTALDYDDAIIDRYDTTGNKRLSLDRFGRHYFYPPANKSYEIVKPPQGSIQSRRRDFQREGLVEVDFGVKNGADIDANRFAVGYGDVFTVATLRRCCCPVDNDSQHPTD